MEKVEKMAIIICFLAFFFLVCLILVLFTVRIYAKSQLESQKSFSLQGREDIEELSVKDYQEKIKLINSELVKLDNFYNNKFYFTPLIERIAALLPETVYLNDISLIFMPGEEGNSDTIKVALAGFSPTRELLYELQNKLEAEKDFINPGFPSSNWLEDINIDFSVSFDLNIKQ